MSKVLEIVPDDPRWPLAFEAERRRIQEALGSLALRIDHNGSTSVPGPAAKSVIDIQISVKRLQPLDAYVSRLESLGYTHLVHPDDAFAPWHADVARDYQALKRRLAPGHSGETLGSQQAYADAKGELIRSVTERALAEGHPRDL